jgi:glycosyltransferase involved in cell wall biosynthesis
LSKKGSTLKTPIATPIIDVIIPAFNEEKSIPSVLKDIPRAWVRDIIVCDNNSTDRTAEVAAANGATVLFQPNKGYGNACLKGLEYVAAKKEKPNIIVFLDGDYWHQLRKGWRIWS